MRGGGGERGKRPSAGFDFVFELPDPPVDGNCMIGCTIFTAANQEEICVNVNIM